LPLVDLRYLRPQFLDVIDQVPRRVRFEARIGRRLTAAALVEDEDLVLVGIELPPVVRARSAAGPTMQEGDGLALRIAAQLPVQAVPVTNI